ncbi:MAG: HAD family phosphatase [Clostridiales bacterium]|nr:HAD family phosphatase [Clostridiales bacterium]
MLEGIKAVIFDLDGTLIDSMWMWKAIDIEYLGRYGYECPETLQREIEGMSFTETANFFKERFHLPDPIQKIKDDWNAMAFDKYKNEVTMKPGMLELLKELRKKGIKTGIATSNSKELVNTVIESLQIGEYFDEIHTSCEVAKGKPAPDIYLLVAKCLGVEPKDCLVFEDVPLGIMAGKNAGMKVCAVADDYSKAMAEEKRELADYWRD